MKHIKYFSHFVLGLVLAGAGALAQAADVGQGYVSVFIGQSDAEVDINSVEADGDDTSFRIGGGYRVNENFAVEGYYIDYGEVDDTVFGFDISAEATAFQFQVVGLVPVNPTVDLYGKVGLALWDAEITVSGVFDDDDDGTDLVFGFGAGFKVGKDVDLRVEYEISEFDDFDVDTIMIGLNIGF